MKNKNLYKVIMRDDNAIVADEETFIRAFTAQDAWFMAENNDVFQYKRPIRISCVEGKEEISIRQEYPKVG